MLAGVVVEADPDDMAVQSPHPDYRISLSALESSVHVRAEDQVQSHDTAPPTETGPGEWERQTVTLLRIAG